MAEWTTEDAQAERLVYEVTIADKGAGGHYATVVAAKNWLAAHDAEFKGEAWREHTPRLTEALRDIVVERATHAERGWTAEHDAEHGVHHLLALAADHLAPQQLHQTPERGPLVKGASLLVAAIELLDRQEADHG